MFAKIISLTEANNEIKASLKFHQEARNKNIYSVLSPEAQAYFLSNEVSYVFEKTEIEELFDKNPDATALRVYYAAREHTQSTLVMVAADITSNEWPSITCKNLINSDDEAALEWPTIMTLTAKSIDDFDIAKD